MAAFLAMAPMAALLAMAAMAPMATNRLSFLLTREWYVVAESATRVRNWLKMFDSRPACRLLSLGRMKDRAWIDALEDRTCRFAIDIVDLAKRLRVFPELRAACDQLNDAAGSVGANHRAVGRSRSTPEFAAKLQIVNEEADEAAHWLFVLKTTNRNASLQPAINAAHQEAVELRNIFAKSRSTTRTRFFSEDSAKPRRRRR